nr:hypothetical protein [uncultured Flavobacterium sp.]
MFDEYNQYNEGAFTPTEQSNYQPMTSVGGSYETPWDFNTLPVVNHYFEYIRWYDDFPYIRVTPYIGLAYYDGADDGTYNTPAGAFNLAAGGYPSLYNNGLEAGNYIEANPIILGVNTYSTHELAIMPNAAFPNDHCQVQGADINPYNPEGVFFDLIDNHFVQPQVLVPGDAVTPASSATPQERDLLAQFGKVFYYKIEIGDGPSSYYDTVYISAFEIDQLLLTPANNFFNIGYTDQPFGGDLYFHTGSNEIVVDMPTTLPSGLNMHLNYPSSQVYVDSTGRDWYFDSHFNGRISGLSLYIYTF